MSEQERVERKVFGLCEPSEVTQITMNGIDWIGVSNGEVNGRGRNIFIADDGEESIAIPLGRVRAIRFVKAS